MDVSVSLLFTFSIAARCMLCRYARFISIFKGALALRSFESSNSLGSLALALYPLPVKDFTEGICPPANFVLPDL